MNLAEDPLPRSHADGRRHPFRCCGAGSRSQHDHQYQHCPGLV